MVEREKVFHLSAKFRIENLVSSLLSPFAFRSCWAIFSASDLTISANEFVFDFCVLDFCEVQEGRAEELISYRSRLLAFLYCALCHVSSRPCADHSNHSMLSVQSTPVRVTKETLYMVFICSIMQCLLCLCQAVNH